MPAAGGDALVSASELTLIETLTGTAGATVGDYNWTVES